MVLVAAVLLGRTFCAAPLDPPPAYAGELPAASPPAGMQLVHLPTGVIHRSAGFAYRGGSFTDERRFAMSAAWVRHPAGDLLIDAGFGRNIDVHFRMMPAFFRAFTAYEKGRTAREQLEAMPGYDRSRLRILLTHAHWDHVSGADDFPGVPILVPPEERRFVRDGGWITGVARAVRGARWEEYRFEGGPYLGFPRSHDLHGDGSIVVVPAPGHTPGSVVVFVAVPGGRRYAFVGDLVWQREGITEREERPWLFRSLADEDPEGVRESILRMSALVRRFPDLVLVPAHDARGLADLP